MTEDEALQEIDRLVAEGKLPSRDNGWPDGTEIFEVDIDLGTGSLPWRAKVVGFTLAAFKIAGPGIVVGDGTGPQEMNMPIRHCKLVKD